MGSRVRKERRCVNVSVGGEIVIVPGVRSDEV